MLKRPYRKTVLTTAVSACLGVLATPTALAQIEEVVVTAQKREENLQNTPLAISALTSASMEKLGVSDFTNIAKTVPSLTLTPYPSGDIVILFMRGQGVADPMQVTSDGSVGLYLDGFYISRSQGALFDLADLERVEVLRGPQGTLYGRNTTGGAVNLISKEPTGNFGFKQSLTFGTRNQFRSLTAVDLPKVGGLSSKVTLLKSSRDGYVKNTGSSHDYGENEQLAGRLMLKWEINDALTADYFFETGTLESTPVYYQNSNTTPGLDLTQVYPGYKSSPTSRTYRPVDLPLSNSDFEGHGLTLTWDVSDDFTIKSLTGYREIGFDSSQDYAETFLVPAQSHDIVDNHQFSQELQFLGSALDDRLQFVTGLYYFEEGSSHYEYYHTDARLFGLGDSVKDRNVDAESKSQAIYSQLTWTPGLLDDRLDIILGARYTRDKRSASRDLIIDDSQLGLSRDIGANRQDFSRFNPALTVNVNWSGDLTTYAKVITGYKAGGSSEGAARFDQTYGPEEVTTYELGMKSYWWDHRVRLNGALFYNDFEDMQMQFVADSHDSSVIQGYNAGKANVSGAEVELLVMPVDDLTLTLDYTYLHTKFDKVDVIPNTMFDGSVNPASPYAVGDNIKDLFVLSYAPRHSLNAGLDYTFLRFAQGSLSFNMNYRWQSRIYNTQPAGPAVAGRNWYSVPTYGLLDARFTLDVDLPRGDTARIGLWGKNITDKTYRQQSTGVGDPLAGFTGAAIAWSEPASFGIDLVYQY